MMEIREAKQGDSETVKKVPAESLSAQQPPGSQVSSIKAIYEGLREQDSPVRYQRSIRYTIAEERGKTVGLCVICTHSDGFAKYADVQDLYVVIGQRRKGSGSALLRAAIDIAKRDECSLLIALPPQPDQSVVPFLKRHGLERGEHIPYILSLSSA